MNDSARAAWPLGIERVEWLSEDGDHLTVRVTGRWRRRRPASSTQPTLVIDAPGHKHRFPAIPEPPSLTGVPPGMWRISFAVPSALAPDLRSSASLQVGGAVVPLPAAVEDGVDRRPPPSAELETEAIPRPPGPRASLDGAARERERLGFERELIVRRRDAASRVPTEPAAPAVVAAAGGLRGTVRADGAVSAAEDRAPVSALRAELDQRARAQAALWARLIDAETRMAARQLLQRRTTATLQMLRDELEGLREALGREREARRAAELRVTELEAELERLRRPPRSGAEPDAVGAVAPGAEPGAVGPVAPGAEPAVRLGEALARLRDGIAPLDEPPADEPAADEPPADEPPADEPLLNEPLEDRAPSSRPGPPEQPQAVQRPWLREVVTALTKTDPDLTGRLIVDLLPAQRAVDPTPVTYDLVLGGELGCVRVAVDDTGARVLADQPARPPGEVDFRVLGGYAAIARLLSAGRIRRRFGLRVARVRGKRTGLARIDAVLDARLGLSELYDAGVRMHPRTALALLAQLIEREPASPAIEPGPASPPRFRLAYYSPPEKIAYLVAGGGLPPQILQTAPGGPIATTISGPAGSLERVLAGAAGKDKLVIGDDRPLTYLRESIMRAQSA